MERQYWRGANLLNPVPLVLVSCSDEKEDNVMTAAWAGTVCSDPVMVSVSIRKSRHSHQIIKNSGEFVLNLVSEDIVKAADYVGVFSGKNIDKFNLPNDFHLTKQPSKEVKAISIAESPLTLECKVVNILELGSHDMFIGQVVATGVREDIIDKNNKLDLDKAKLVAYSHGEYRALGKKLGTFGFAVKKGERPKTVRKENKK
ncbi:MAG: flavin reductase family protein [Erysipelotrichaceae bacterium]|nr:flavin reductase family protein [Erysipelotrichaceae bacterium]